ncbi:uncharacterized protein EI97DRAFT_257602 [Westerdykella ornata]|uniref:Uncharacterized protein n=1 Tax=Westerdykella ornata TaxID=318751 RepID=A0A6A6JQ80_WESOR|nr:uncharacterized protein EI97DRAFT_257602 [Westerdykella ornata]KAF2278537.1 hypothetical protein EI97DRAFT_257602 [Westerdykella ornata]
MDKGAVQNRYNYPIFRCGTAREPPNLQWHIRLFRTLNSSVHLTPTPQPLSYTLDNIPSHSKISPSAPCGRQSCPEPSFHIRTSPPSSMAAASWDFKRPTMNLQLDWALFNILSPELRTLVFRAVFSNPGGSFTSPAMRRCRKCEHGHSSGAMIWIRCFQHGSIHAMENRESLLTTFIVLSPKRTIDSWLFC